MRTHQAGTSVLAALVFVAIFVLFISGYKIASQEASQQSAAAASAIAETSTTCMQGEVYTVDMQSGTGSVGKLTCASGDERTECEQFVSGKCAVRYCPPSSYVTESGTCFVMATCESGNEPCLKSTIQNASQPQQAASIIAARLLSDKGATDARAPGSSKTLVLAEKLSESGRTAVTGVIDQTAAAAAENNFDTDALLAIARNIKDAQSVRPVEGPVAQISCQPKIAESGMKVGIAFGCANSVSSEGGGFSTGDRLWGATEDRLALNLPNGTMTYALNCSDGVRTASASCSVAVMKPFMLLTSQAEDGVASFAWVTRGMDQCELSAPNNVELSAQFLNPVPQSGALSVSSSASETRVALTCTTVGGEVKEVTTTAR